MKDETKKWQTQSNKDKVCFYLITRGVAFLEKTVKLTPKKRRKMTP